MIHSHKVKGMNVATFRCFCLAFLAAFFGLDGGVLPAWLPLMYSTKSSIPSVPLRAEAPLIFPEEVDESWLEIEPWL